MRRDHKNHIGSPCRPAFPFDISLRILSWTSSRSSLCCNIVLEADFQFFNASCFTSNLLGMSCGILAIKSPFETKATFTCKSPSSGKFSTCKAASSRSSSFFISRLAKDNDLRDESLHVGELTRTALRHGLFPCGVLRRRFEGATFSLFGVDKLLFCSSSDDLSSPYMCPRFLILWARLLQTLLEYLEESFGT